MIILNKATDMNVKKHGGYPTIFQVNLEEPRAQFSPFESTDDLTKLSKIKVR